MKRPSTNERRAEIIRTAAEVFFEQGYAATSIDAIIERLGGSKRNIYKEFGSKEGLFTAIVSQTADDVLNSLPVEEVSACNLQETLSAFACRLLTAYMSPELIGALRAIMAEAFRLPDLAKGFYDRGPGRASARVTEVLEEAKKRGEIVVEDCAKAADFFVGMLRGNVHLQVVLGLRSPLTPAEIESSARLAVEIFLNGLRTTADRSPRRHR